MPLDMLYGDAAHHPGGGGVAAGYDIPRSLRFNSVDSAWLSRTFGRAGNGNKWAVAFGLKRSNLGVAQYIFSTGSSWGTNNLLGAVYLDASDRLNFWMFNVSTTHAHVITTRVFRDTTAFCHILLCYDDTQAIAAERVRIFVNGIRVTAFDGTQYPSQNFNSYFNQTYQHGIGQYSGNGMANFLNGYLCEFHFFDGYNPSPWELLEIEPTSKAVRIKQPSFTSSQYGANGSYLRFADNAGATATTLGKDTAPTGTGHASANNWTPNNFSVTPGVGNDSVIDTPTNNHANFSLIAPTIASGVTLWNGGLQYQCGGTGRSIRCPWGMSTGKWYWEFYPSTSNHRIGIAQQGSSAGDPVGGADGRSWAYDGGGNKVLSNSGSAYGASYTNGDVIGVKFDADTGALEFLKNNVSQGVAYSGLLNGPYYPAVSDNGTQVSGYCNFGQQAFTYSLPSGYKALCTGTMDVPAIPDPSAHVDVKLYRGNGGNLQVGNIVKEAATVSIPKAIRFNDDDSARLTRSITATGNPQKVFFSAHLKRGNVGTAQTLFGAQNAGGAFWDEIGFNASDQLTIRFDLGNTGPAYTSTEVFRDPSTPLHLVVAIDTTQATAADRVKAWVNNVPLTLTGGPVALNYNTRWNTSGNTEGIATGVNYTAVTGPSSVFDGYLSEINRLDGTLLTPTDFGQYDANGVWGPKTISLTSSQYGVNGFRLEFADVSAATATALGKDTAPTGAGHASANNWTPTNLSVAAGSGNDALDDTPTNPFCTWDPLTRGGGTTANGNLDFNSGGGSATFYSVKATIPALIKCYWEHEVPATLTYWYPGIIRGDLQLSNGGIYFLGGASGPAESIGYRSSDGAILQGGSTLFAGTAAGAAGSVIMFAFDPTTGKLWVGRNGTWFNSGNPAAGTGWVAIVNTDYTWHPALTDAASQATVVNFGQRPFAHTPPSGFSALSRDNLAAFGEVAGSPDIVWIKGRSAATGWGIYDTVRGATKEFEFASQSPAETTQLNGLKAFGRDGFYLGNLAKLNTLNATYAAYLFNASNTAGIKVMTYTGNGSTQAISHNLGVKPGMIIVRALTLTTVHACVYHVGLGATHYGYMSASVFDTASAINRWGNNSVVVEPTTTQFTVGNNNDVNANGVVYVAYVFAPIAGFSAFGVMRGNSSADGPLIFTGFRPKVLYLKRTANAGDNGRLWDSARRVENVMGPAIYPTAANAEATENLVDFLATGFKMRSSDASVNGSSNDYVWSAWADVPLKYALAR